MYDIIARYYDLVHAELTEDIDYILSLAQRFDSPILELGCGSGRILFPLAQAGSTVTGVDSSRAMLSRAEKRLAGESIETRRRIRLFESRMESLDLGREQSGFGLVIIPYNTLMHLDPEDIVRTFKRVAANLRPQGCLFIDLINPHLVAQSPDEPSLVHERVLTDPDSGEKVVQLSSSRLDEFSQTIHITWVFEESAGDPESDKRSVAQLKYHYLFPHQLELALAEAGLQLDSITGNYEGAPFHEESERLLLLASKDA